MSRFRAKLTAAMQRNQTDKALLLRPLKPAMPVPMAFLDDPFFPFSRATVAATRDVVCAYVFDFAAYLAQGASGAIALERSIAFVGDEVPVMLHGPFTGAGFAPMVYEDAFHADAATVVCSRDYAAFATNATREAFVQRNGPTPLPTRVPAYWWRANAFTMPGTGEGEATLHVRVAPEAVLYADATDDFAQGCRAALLAW